MQQKLIHLTSLFHEARDILSAINLLPWDQATYTLGNILSAMFYEKAFSAHPEIPDEIQQGKFSTLHSWLDQNIYQYGSKYPAPELIHRVAGSQLDVQPLLRNIKMKYGELYQL